MLRTLFSGAVSRLLIFAIRALRFSGVNTSVTWHFEKLLDAIRDHGGETGWHGVPDLLRDLYFRAAEDELIREGLKSCGLPMRDRTILRRMQIAAFLGLEQLGP